MNRFIFCPARKLDHVHDQHVSCTSGLSLSPTKAIAHLLQKLSMEKSLFIAVTHLQYYTKQVAKICGFSSDLEDNMLGRFLDTLSEFATEAACCKEY